MTVRNPKPPRHCHLELVLYADSMYLRLTVLIVPCRLFTVCTTLAGYFNRRAFDII